MHPPEPPGVDVLGGRWGWVGIGRDRLDINDAFYVFVALPITISALIGPRSVWDVVVIVCGVILLVRAAIRVGLHVAGRLPTQRTRAPRHQA